MNRKRDTVNHPTFRKTCIVAKRRTTSIGCAQRGKAKLAIPNFTLAATGRETTRMEDPEYLTRQLLTYIGNKRAFLAHIGAAVEHVKRRLGKKRLRFLDVFSGSGIVSRFAKAHASLLISNDIEEYAAVTARCYLSNRSYVHRQALDGIIADLNHRVHDSSMPSGFVEQLYAPRDETNITASDRVFYTRDNARRLDNYRRLIDETRSEFRDLLLGPLLAKASVHANTAGVFKGFYKDRRTKVGRYGGSGDDALNRIKGKIFLEPPILSRFECDYEVHQQDANKLVRGLDKLDLAYIDPPYNQHPYGSNYFMLNLLVRYRRPSRMSRVSGIPADWTRSGYNVRARSLSLLSDLLQAIDAPFLLVSFNDEGFVSPSAMRGLLAEIGTVQSIETRYNAFRGCRNLHSRDIHVTEQLFLIERR